LWHGAGWTFVIWGAMHGLLVLTSHLWRRWSPIRLPRAISWAATVLAAVCLWVVFRSPSGAVAIKVLTAMTFSTPAASAPALVDTLAYGPAWALTLALGASALFLPNSRWLARRLRQGRLARHDRAVSAPARPAFVVQAVVAGAILYFAITSIGTMQSKFIYFNF
jgi:alginate O-acetyltransferase complex protein AlgI